MTDFVYANGDTVTFADGVIATAGHATTANVDSNDRVWTMQPDLTLPAGVKPTYPVGIDWDNPLARGLEYCQLFRPGLVNLVNGVPDTVTGNVTLEKDYASFPNDHTAYITCNTDFDQVIEGTSGFSVVAIAEFAGFGGNAVVVARAGTVTDGWMIREISSQANFYADAGRANLTYTGTLSADTKYVLGVTTDAGVGLGGTVYRDGDAGGTDPTSDFNPSNVATAITIGGNNAIDADEFDGKIYCVLGYSRPLTAGEHLALAQDPYQFLKSPVPQTQIITDQPTANDRVWVI